MSKPITQETARELLATIQTNVAAIERLFDDGMYDAPDHVVEKLKGLLKMNRAIAAKAEGGQ